MKKLSQKELEAFETLIKRAAKNGQLSVGCMWNDTGYTVTALKVQTQLWPEDGGDVVLAITEKDLRSIVGMVNRSKARPRKLSSEDARAMAKKRHAITP